MMLATVPDPVALALLTLAGALPVVVFGGWLTRRGSGARVGTQALVVALAPLMATWVGALVAARAMFISGHDLGAFIIIAATAGAVGVISAWRLARRVRHDADGLGPERSPPVTSRTGPRPPR
jgi:hypothetical protein